MPAWITGMLICFKHGHAVPSCEDSVASPQQAIYYHASRWLRMAALWLSRVKRQGSGQRTLNGVRSIRFKETGVVMVVYQTF